MAPVNLFTTIFLGYWIRILCFLRVRSVSGSHAEEIMTSHFLLARQRFMYVQVLYSFSERDYICTKWLKDLFKSTSATAQKGGIGQREGWWRERGQTEIVTPLQAPRLHLTFCSTLAGEHEPELLVSFSNFLSEEVWGSAQEWLAEQNHNALSKTKSWVKSYLQLERTVSLVPMRYEDRDKASGCKKLKNQSRAWRLKGERRPLDRPNNSRTWNGKLKCWFWRSWRVEKKRSEEVEKWWRNYSAGVMTVGRDMGWKIREMEIKGEEGEEVNYLAKKECVLCWNNKSEEM